MKIILITLAIIGALGYGVYRYMPELFATIADFTQLASIVSVPHYSYTEKYTDSQYRFNFLHPKDFSVTAAPGEGGVGKILLVENVPEKIGMQIIISPFGEEVQITAEFLKENAPEVNVKKSREVTFSTDQKGLRFNSENEEFDGESSELWFIRNKNLYQISTYANFGSELDNFFVTWHFE